MLKDEIKFALDDLQEKMEYELKEAADKDVANLEGQIEGVIRAQERLADL